METELEMKALELKASEGKLSIRTQQLEASEGKLIMLSLELQASDDRVANLTRQLQGSENELSKSILQLKVSDGQLIASTLKGNASEIRHQVDDDKRDELLAQLRKALSGKTVLLQELHHRVKNNLAVIASLLEMQADTFTDEKAIRAFSESQQRVMSMALIHESLYDRDVMDRLNFREYLQKLVDQVQAAYPIEADLVSVNVTAEDIDLPMHRVISCGLIANELLSNAFKFAYRRDNGGGVINIQFARLASGSLSLSCEDHGVGIPESFDWKNASSLGLRIIQILTSQLDGELTLDRSQGTKFQIVFPDYPIDPRS